MTESETVTIEVPVVEETPPESASATEIAEAIVEAQVEAAEEIQLQEDVEQAEEMATSALESVATHAHEEYALIGHDHPELGERITHIESQLVSLLSEMEETETNDDAELVEPTEEREPEKEPDPIRHSRFKRGRRR